MFHPGIKY